MFNRLITYYSCEGDPAVIRKSIEKAVIEIIEIPVNGDQLLASWND
jgi:hypothetical protein